MRRQEFTLPVRQPEDQHFRLQPLETSGHVVVDAFHWASDNLAPLGVVGVILNDPIDGGRNTLVKLCNAFDGGASWCVDRPWHRPPVFARDRGHMAFAVDRDSERNAAARLGWVRQRD